MSIIEYLSHPVINALGWTVLHSLWQVALIALLWFLIMRGTQKHAATVRYNISLLALLAIPASFVFTFFRQYAVYSNARQIVSVEFEEMAWLAMDGSRQFFLIDKGQPDLLGRFEALTPWVFWLYLTGVALFAVHAAFAYSKLFLLKRKNIRPIPEEWMQRYKGLKQKAGLRIEVPVWLSSKVDTPMVVGFLKPAILIPLSMLSSLPPEQVESILLHELYHIRRKDHYINAAQTLMEILFFYHPATWLISNRIRKERELRVDEWIVKEINNPVMYARALVSLEEKRGNRAMQPALAATQSKSQLFTRIKHMMTMKTRKFNAGQKLAALLALVFAFISVAWIHPAQTAAMPMGNNGYLDMYHIFEREAHGNSDSPGAWSESQATVSEQTAAEGPQESAPARQAVTTDPEPRNIRFHDGTTMAWDTLSKKDREEIRRAIEEARIALQEMNKELHETFHSGEFRRQMQESRHEFEQAMKEIQEQFQSEEFQREMRQAGESFREGMEELRLKFESDDFQREMKEAMEELRKALEALQAVEREKSMEPEKEETP